MGAFFQTNKIVDEVIELDKKSRKSIKYFFSKMSEKDIRYLFCMHRSFHSAWILRKVRAQKKISYKTWWSKSFFDESILRSMYLPEVLRALVLLSPVDDNIKKRIEYFSLDKKFHNSTERSSIIRWPYSIPADLLPTVEAEKSSVTSTLSRLQINRPYVVIAPSSQWATKRWTDSGFIELIQLLSERGLNAYIIGASNEIEHCREIEKKAQARQLSVEVRSLAGKTDLIELHHVLSKAEVIVANDSGPMHMATVSGRPVVGIFGPTTIDQGYRPWSDSSIVVQTDLSCRPCGKHGHKKCPIGTHDCMKKITAQEVAAAISPSQIY
ncbi:MAG: hypothetical protein A2Z20_00625 [Bdellovibrionales bacterium RBG_16_40_8]|nr:MAG: hypothetical protein A2Z20_00625 [Bdellovibrionales bacterium RBG_16_40_8]